MPGHARHPHTRIRPAFIRRERHRIARRSRIREIVLGSQDGIVTSVGVLSSMFGAHLRNEALLLVGIAAGIAGTISMACGQYLASKASTDLKRRELQVEREKVRDDPESERDELVAIYRGHGLSETLAKRVASIVERHPRRTMAVMAREELGIDLKTPPAPLIEAVVVGISYICGASMPLLPYALVAGSSAFWASVAVALACLAGVGALKAISVDGRITIAALESMAIGSGAALAGYVVGNLVPHLLGIGVSLR